ncbi:hypothetical protein ACGF12_06615 [Kitasatospora sp. NPDC048296]|uniref:hypothetical protein n=1 Tax=Kitasatospora sp. NPDC048296 TaxID=3364048 RepID=UPI0037133EBB
MRLRCVGVEVVHQGDWLILDWEDGGQLRMPLHSCTDLDIQPIEENQHTQIVLAFTPLAENGTRGAGRINVRLEATPEHTVDAHEFLQFLRVRTTAEDQAAALPRPGQPQSPEADWISFPPAGETRELHEQVLQRIGDHRPL